MHASLRRWRSPKTTCGFGLTAASTRSCARPRARYQLESIARRTRAVRTRHTWVIRRSTGGDRFQRLADTACDCDRRWVPNTIFSVTFSSLPFYNSSQSSPERTLFSVLGLISYQTNNFKVRLDRQPESFDFTIRFYVETTPHTTTFLCQYSIVFATQVQYTTTNKTNTESITHTSPYSRRSSVAQTHMLYIDSTFCVLCLVDVP